jgi:hypothetical protein
MEIRRLVGEIAADSSAAEAAWQVLRGLGPGVASYLLDAYPTAKRWQGRTALVFHAIRFARASEAAYALGLRSLGDKSHMIRCRACMERNAGGSQTGSWLTTVGSCLSS